MSFNRDNITWQSKNGTWNLGFFRVAWVGSEADGYDPEWDVEYDCSSFEWVSTGHSSEHRANQSWSGVNPGSQTILSWTRENAKEAAEYDQMAYFLQNPEALRQHQIAEKKKKVKAHQVKVKEYLADRTLASMRQMVMVTYDASPNSNDLAVTCSIRAYGREDGTWLTVDGKRVYNFATKRVAKGILKVEVVPSRRW